MTNNKQQTAVDVKELTLKLYPFGGNSVRNAFIAGYNKAKEMDKERIENAYNSGYNNGGLDTCLTPKQYYEQTYGDNNE
jgi:hypothetical protein